MPKRSLKLKVRIPNYVSDWAAWRRAINKAVCTAQDGGRVKYSRHDKLEVEVRFHLTNPKLTRLDVDNRLKDVFDALQGCIGDKGKSGKLRRIIPNDDQIYRVIAEKRLPPKADREAESTIVIRGYNRHGATKRHPRDRRKHGDRPREPRR